MSLGVVLRRAALTGALAAAAAGALAAAEIGALHLALQKPVAMRRLEATLYLSYAGESRDVACAALPVGAGGRLPARGRMRLSLLGDGAPTPWRSAALARTLDDRGEARFPAAEIAALAGAAPAQARIDLLEVVLKGGKGKKVSALTLDCALEAAE